MITTLLGILAATLSVVAFAPQAWRVIRTRKTGELATMMWVTNVAAFSLWAAYGVTLRAWAIIVPNLICLAFSIFILIMKLVSPPTRHAIADVLDPAVDSQAGQGVTPRPRG